MIPIGEISCSLIFISRLGRFEPPWHKPVTSFRDLNISTIEMILNDPNWTKAIFFRDPPHRFVGLSFSSSSNCFWRLLSAYTYLVVHDGDPRLRKRFVDQTITLQMKPIWTTFASLVINETNPQPLRDLHFRPQVGGSLNS
jgi:hypothetical protein